MAGASNYLEDKLLDWLGGTAFPSAPGALYVGLYNGDPLDSAAGGTEVTTTIRAAGRVAVTLGSKVTNTGANTRAPTARSSTSASALVQRRLTTSLCSTPARPATCSSAAHSALRAA